MNINTWIQKNETPLVFGLMVFVCVLFIFLHSISPGMEGGMDSYMHFLISKNSWTHHHLFLDQWGKPLFTIFSSPFAQFGLSGLVVFNILCLVASAYLTFKVAKIYQWEYAFFAFLFVLFLPIFNVNIVSGLTEPFNALLLALCFWLFASKQYAWAAILAGFLPFARSEGFVIIAAIGFFLFFIEKKYKYFALLLVGSLVFNVLGWIIDGDPFWIITQNPYIKAQVNDKNLCGSGGLLHYFKLSDQITGLWMALLIVLGLLYSARDYFANKVRSIDVSQTLWLAGGTMTLYYAAHGFIWWKGIMGSCGYIRVMVVLAPAYGLLAAYALQQILPKIKNQMWLNALLVFLVINTIIYTPVKQNKKRYPILIDKEQTVFKEVATWLESMPEIRQKPKMYLYPYLSILLHANHFDESDHKDFWGTSLQYLQKGDILIWDGHFGPNESATPLESLKSDPSLRLLKSFIPTPSFKTCNDYDFEVHVFEKIM